MQNPSLVYLHMPIGNNYGWAVCGKYLLKELSKRTEVKLVDQGIEGQMRTEEEEMMVMKHRSKDKGRVDAPVIHTINNLTFESYSPVWSRKKNIAYLFSEKPFMTKKQKTNAKRFDVLVAGSEWNARILRENGLDAISIPQGVDMEIFHPQKKKVKSFAVFSGGKMEHRKGQDLVLAAFEELLKRVPEAYLFAAWTNIWDFENYSQTMQGIQMRNIVPIKLSDQHTLASVMNNSSFGVFPNRIEGGTNLMLMEFLACGKTASVNVSTGQKDVVTEEYAFPMLGDDNKMIQEMADRMEYAYYMPEKLEPMGERAAEAMKNFSWGKCAERFLELC